MGVSVSNAHSGQSFSHPFQPVLVGMGLRFVRGAVDGFQPTIAGVPMTGNAGTLPPVLPLKGATSTTKETWAILQVTPNSKGQLDKDSKIEIIHSATLDDGTVTVGRHPIALIIWRAKRPVAVWPITFFNLKYAQKKTEKDGVRHFFL